jgi:hypothetical protein
MTEKVKKAIITHDECNSCEYRDVCFIPLKLLHKLMRICKQGRKSPVRVKSKDQSTLDETANAPPLVS